MKSFVLLLLIFVLFEGERATVDASSSSGGDKKGGPVPPTANLLNPLELLRKKLNPDLTAEDLNMESVLAAPTKRFGYETPTLDQIKQVRAATSSMQGTTVKANWAKSGNVAQYNGFKTEPYVTIPIHLNVIFIGFEGDGHHSLKLDEAQLRKWFTSLEHKVEHIRLDSDESAEKSHVYYEYHYRVIEFDKDVNTVLEAIIWDHARPENPWSTNIQDALTYFVDITALTDVLDTITDSLQLDESYTLFVLNPKLPHHGFRYGYRYGFSEAELVRLRSSVGLIMELQRRDPPRPLPDFPEIFLADPDDHRNPNTTQKLQIRSLRQASHEWAELYMLQMHELSYWKRHPLEEDDSTDNNSGEEPAPPPRDMMFEVAATKLLQSNSPSDKEYMRSVLHEPYATPNCLVDSWVSDKRYAVVDLSAGPFAWGPIVGGDGVKTQRSNPNIADISVALRDFSAGGQFNDTAYVHRIEKQFRKHGIEILQKEMEILVRFLDENCKTGQDTSEGEVKTCKAWRHKLSAVETYISKHKGEKTVDAKVVEQLAMISGGPHHGAPELLILEGLFSKLGNIIHSLQRHVITPPVSTAIGPYAQQVKFHIYIIRNHNDYEPTDPENFDFQEFKRQIDDLALPRQRFSYTLSSHTMSDDIGLAMAYARSLRSAVVGSLKIDGQFVSSKRMYLDSASVESHLRSLHSKFKESEPEIWSDDNGGGVRTIPIFIFSLDFPLPVLIDKYFQAKALSDMVVAMQSDDTDFDSHIGCNGHVVQWNLRNPLRAVLAATAQHLGGVFPFHYGVNEATGRTDQNWFWAVGCSPLSLTSTTPGNFSQFTVDAIHRNYVAEGMSVALKTSNAAIMELKNAKTGAGSEKVFKLIPNDKMVQQHITITQAFHKIGVHLRFLDFTGAIPIVHAAMRNARHLLSTADDVNTFLNIDHCIRGDSGKGQSTGLDWTFWIVAVLAITSIVAYVTYRPKHFKPKLI